MIDVGARLDEVGCTCRTCCLQGSVSGALNVTFFVVISGIYLLSVCLQNTARALCSFGAFGLHEGGSIVFVLIVELLLLFTGSISTTALQHRHGSVAA